MLTVVTRKDPKISSLSITRHVTCKEEMDEIIDQQPEGRLITLNSMDMPFIQHKIDIPEDEQPSLRKFRSGEAFTLAIYNVSSDDIDVPLMGFSIRRVRGGQNILVKGSKSLIDPSKAGLTKPAIAVIPLVHLFEEQIRKEAKYAADLIAKATDRKHVVSLSDERDKRMMDAALTATYNVMSALQGRCNRRDEKPKTGKACLQESLDQTLMASDEFYSSLMRRAREVFDPSIRSLANDIALEHLRMN
jgi:hypothetical protein